jgi:drug/metabolite transporter (DMT)-like permease
VIAIALFGQVLAQGLTVYSLKVLSSSLVALSMLVIPIFSHIEARFIFSEPTSLHELFRLFYRFVRNVLGDLWQGWD